MEQEKMFDRDRRKWVTPEEKERREDDLAALINTIGTSLAALSLTREEFRNVLDEVRERMTFGGFNSIESNEKGPGGDAPEPQEK